MTIFSVGIVGRNLNEEPLVEMANATEGRYASADSDELVGLFERIGSALDNRLVARFTASESDHIEVTFGAIYDNELLAVPETLVVPGFLVTTPSVATTTSQVTPSTYSKTSALPASPSTLADPHRGSGFRRGCHVRPHPGLGPRRRGASRRPAEGVRNTRAACRTWWHPEQASHLPSSLRTGGGGCTAAWLDRGDQHGARFGEHPAPPRRSDRRSHRPRCGHRRLGGGGDEVLAMGRCRSSSSPF